jgi:hypothetical protein
MIEAIASQINTSQGDRYLLKVKRRSLSALNYVKQMLGL